jgi:hypothetical protein
MNTYTIEELDHEEIEFLPPRVVMCASSPCCCRPTIQICIGVRLCCIETTAVVKAG